MSISTIASDLKQLVGFAKKLGGARAELERRIEELKQKREWIQESPLTREDYIERCNKFFDVRRATYLAQLALTVEIRQRRPMQDFSDWPRGKNPIGVVNMANYPAKTSPDVLMGFLAGPNPFADPAADGGPESGYLQARYAADLLEVDWPKDCGPPPARRPKLIARCDDEITKLEKQLSSLIDTLDREVRP